MKLFKPKAPVLPPEGARFTFSFGSDFRHAPPVTVELNNAIARVAQELVTLRSDIAAGKGVRSVTSLERELAGEQVEQKRTNATLEQMRRQLGAGVITPDQFKPYSAASSAVYTRISKINKDIQTRRKADAAQAQLKQITQTLQ